MFRFEFGSHFRWVPLMHDSRYGRPNPGDLVAVNRKAYRVVEIRERAVVDWKHEDHDRYEMERDVDAKQGKAFPVKEEWEERPYVAVLRPDKLRPTANDNDGTECYGIRPWKRSAWLHLPEQYAVCAECGELAPCRDILAERESARQAEILDKKLSILPGCCWDCREPVTKRQKSITFEGPNLEIPGGPEPVVFHLRRDCHDGAATYEEKWVEANPAERRLTLRCPGFKTLHIDGAECNEGDLCPGDVSHKQGWSDHTYVLNEPRFREQIAAYLAENGVDELFRTRVFQRCLRCADAFERGDYEIPADTPA